MRCHFTSDNYPGAQNFISYLSLLNIILFLFINTKNLKEIFMSSHGEQFNQSKLSRFLNSVNGRIFRIGAGLIFMIAGALLLNNVLGIIFILWSLFPLSAGSFDICYISAALGGPFSGNKIRKYQESLTQQTK